MKEILPKSQMIKNPALRGVQRDYVMRSWNTATENCSFCESGVCKNWKVKYFVSMCIFIYSNCITFFGKFCKSRFETYRYIFYKYFNRWNKEVFIALIIILLRSSCLGLCFALLFCIFVDSSLSFVPFGKLLSLVRFSSWNLSCYFLWPIVRSIYSKRWKPLYCNIVKVSCFLLKLDN